MSRIVQVEATSPGGWGLGVAYESGALALIFLRWLIEVSW